MTPYSTEEWKRYKKTRWEVSNLGSARSLRKTKEMPWLNQAGYLKVTIRSKSTGKYKELYIHRMVAKLFVTHVSGETVDHLNGIKTDNRAENLEWVSNAENVSRAHALGLYDQKCQENHMAKLTDDQVLYICSLLDDGVSQSSIANLYNVAPSTISLINSGKRWNDLTNRKEMSYHSSM